LISILSFVKFSKSDEKYGNGKQKLKKRRFKRLGFRDGLKALKLFFSSSSFRPRRAPCRALRLFCFQRASLSNFRRFGFSQFNRQSTPINSQSQKTIKFSLFFDDVYSLFKSVARNWLANFDFPTCYFERHRTF